VLSYVDQAPYRAQIKGMRNLQEGRHDLARHVFQARRGDLRRATTTEWRTSSARSGWS
jgi:TnpA family transposase